MSEQQMNTRLDSLDAELAKQLRSVKDNVILRLFACECALLALTYCGNEDPRLLEAIEVGRRYAKGLADKNELHRAYITAERAAEAADELAFDAYDAVEEGKGLRSRTHLDFFLRKRAEFRKMVVNIFNIRYRARVIAFIFPGV